ncbi:MAG TPA: response regulator [Thermoanaerobaculia bacterium]
MVSERPRALVVDDDEPIRTMITRVLARDGYDVESARDGKEAIEKLEADAYDFVILDLMMPRVDGFGVLRYLKKHRPERLSSVILATAMYADNIAAEPVAAVLTKPFDVGDLRVIAGRFRNGSGEATA